jgi:hypothetical protein
VVACNMANVPLEDASVEVAVFSLSLMGTDYGSFMEEAHRVRARHSTATGGRVPRFSAFFFFPRPEGFSHPRTTPTTRNEGAHSLRAPVRR